MSLSTRVPNAMVRFARPLWRWFWISHRRLYQRSGGQRFATLMGAPLLCLTVPGRRSGHPRPVLLIQTRLGDDLVVCASHAGSPHQPAWWHNLLAAGEATVQIGDQVWTATARPVVDESDRAACWSAVTTTFPDDAGFQRLSTRRFPLARLSPGRPPAADGQPAAAITTA